MKVVFRGLHAVAFFLAFCGFEAARSPSAQKQSPAAPGTATTAEEHLKRGEELSSKGNLDGAIAEFCETLRLKPDYPMAHDDLGAALGGKGDPDAAIAESREAGRRRRTLPRRRVQIDGVAKPTNCSVA